MTSSPWRRLATGVLVLGALTLSACGSGEDESDASAPATEEAATAESSTAEDQGQMAETTAPTDAETVAARMAEWRKSQMAYLSDYASSGGDIKRSPSGVLYTVLSKGDGISLKPGMW